MDSVERFISKIRNIRENPSLTNLKTLVSDIWAWTDIYPSASPAIRDSADSIEDIIAVCFSEERNLTESESLNIKANIEQILSGLENFVV